MKMLSGESGQCQCLPRYNVHTHTTNLDSHKASDLHFIILRTISMMTNDYMANPAPISVRTAQSRY